MKIHPTITEDRILDACERRMTSDHFPLICYGPGWIRILGYGVAFVGPSCPPLFSERNGLTFVVRLGFGWRMKFLRRVPPWMLKRRRPLWIHWRWWFWVYRSAAGGWCVVICGHWLHISETGHISKAWP